MKIPESILEWRTILYSKSIPFAYEIIDKFIKSYNLSNGNGIIEQHRLMENIIKDNSFYEKRKIVERYLETSYMIWFFTEYIKRTDILEKASRNFINGSDDGLGSQFRNFEYECHVAIRFLEEKFSVKSIEHEGCPDFEINDSFTIECKRPTKIEGIFKNTLKSRKQIENYGKPGIVILNIDDLEGLNHSVIEKEFIQLLKISNYAFGIKRSLLLGVILDYVDNINNTSNKGAYTYGLINRYFDLQYKNKKTSLLHDISIGISGDTSINFKKSRILNFNNYKYEWGKDKSDIDQFNKIIISKHWRRNQS